MPLNNAIPNAAIAGSYDASGILIPNPNVPCAYAAPQTSTNLGNFPFFSITTGRCGIEPTKITHQFLNGSLSQIYCVIENGGVKLTDGWFCSDPCALNNAIDNKINKQVGAPCLTSNTLFGGGVLPANGKPAFYMDNLYQGAALPSAVPNPLPAALPTPQHVLMVWDACSNTYNPQQQKLTAGNGITIDALTNTISTTDANDNAGWTINGNTFTAPANAAGKLYQIIIRANVPADTTTHQFGGPNESWLLANLSNVNMAILTASTGFGSGTTDASGLGSAAALGVAALACNVNGVSPVYDGTTEAVLDFKLRVGSGTSYSTSGYFVATADARDGRDNYLTSVPKANTTRILDLPNTPAPIYNPLNSVYRTGSTFNLMTFGHRVADSGGGYMQSEIHYLNPISPMNVKITEVFA